jgi:hypothetical protein
LGVDKTPRHGLFDCQRGQICASQSGSERPCGMPMSDRRHRVLISRDQLSRGRMEAHEQLARLGRSDVGSGFGRRFWARRKGLVSWPGVEVGVASGGSEDGTKTGTKTGTRTKKGHLGDSRVALTRWNDSSWLCRLSREGTRTAAEIQALQGSGHPRLVASRRRCLYLVMWGADEHGGNLARVGKVLVSNVSSGGNVLCGSLILSCWNSPAAHAEKHSSEEVSIIQSRECQT